jgi:general secretion pathway protein N
MSSRLSTLSPLGDYRLQLSGGDVPAINLQTLQGALQLSGSGQVVGSRLRFSGEASAAPAQQDALSNVLNIIGRRQGSKSLISLG